MTRYKIEIPGISECRWLDLEEQRPRQGKQYYILDATTKYKKVE